MAYAAQTSVPVEKSKAEIEKLIMAAGAERYATMNEPGRQSIVFTVLSLNVRFDLPIPGIGDFRKYQHGRGVRTRTDKQMQDAWDQEVRRRWRALGLVIKAKLEAVETGITTFEEEFLAHIVLRGGNTIGAEIIPKLDAVKSGQNIQLLGMD